jgi:NAD(P)-dependent dehydrogenase (short-subunit alcohol dehydrogenase family)
MLKGFQDSADDPQAVYDATVGRIRLNRVASPSEMAEGILYLATARYATGAILQLDGGTTIY